MYIAGFLDDTVFQYDLSTGFDVSTAVYNNVSFYVGNQTPLTDNLAFNNDGTRMYIAGVQGVIYQYNLSTGFDLSTATTTGFVSFSATNQDGSAMGLAFNNNGTIMYILGNNNDIVHQYDLSTGFNISTATYNNVNFYVGNQDTDVHTVIFNNDGTRMYIAGVSTNTIFQYDLSTGFDLSTATTTGIVSFNLGQTTTNPWGLAFNNDGTRMYAIDYNHTILYQYDLT